MIPREEWPPILTVPEATKALAPELTPKDVYLLFRKKDFPLLIAGKRRGRTVTKRDLLNYLEGGHDKNIDIENKQTWQRRY